MCKTDGKYKDNVEMQVNAVKTGATLCHVVL
jgi:hypothetical protein